MSVRSAKESIQRRLEMAEYQLCPKCSGQGIINKPPYVTGDVTEWVDNASAL